jgi:hypothetical protein
MTLIKKMPTKELLEDFIRGMSEEGDHTYFDTNKGIFVNPHEIIVKKK